MIGAEEPDGGVLPPQSVEIGPVGTPQAPVVSEKATTRKYLAYAMTVIVAALFLCLSIRYLIFGDNDDRRDFIHLFEILLTVYGTILGFYFGAQD